MADYNADKMRFEGNLTSGEPKVYETPKEHRDYEGTVQVSENGAWEYNYRVLFTEKLGAVRVQFISKTVGGFSTKEGAEKGCRVAIAAHERDLLAQEYKESQKLVFTIPADEVQT